MCKSSGAGAGACTFLVAPQPFYGPHQFDDSYSDTRTPEEGLKSCDIFLKHGSYWLWTELFGMNLFSRERQLRTAKEPTLQLKQEHGRGLLPLCTLCRFVCSACQRDYHSRIELISHIRRGRGRYKSKLTNSASSMLLQNSAA